MGNENKSIQHFTPPSLAQPSHPASPALGQPKNNRERQLDADHSLSQRHLRQLDQLHMETARTLDRMASVTGFAYADATNRLQAITDSQTHPTVQQRVEAFTTQTIDPILQKALGATLLASAELAHDNLTQRSLPPPEGKKPSFWDKFLEW